MIPGSAIAFKANKAKLDSPEVWMTSMNLWIHHEEGGGGTSSQTGGETCLPSPPGLLPQMSSPLTTPFPPPPPLVPALPLPSPQVLCYASKSEGMFVRESLIFRSDSNGEDLDGYAGVNRVCECDI